jgi:hypothetical protein
VWILSKFHVDRAGQPSKFKNSIFQFDGHTPTGLDWPSCGMESMDNLGRRELQALAKRMGIKANLPVCDFEVSGFGGIFFVTSIYPC